MNQALSFTSGISPPLPFSLDFLFLISRATLIDSKLGHYMKVPPRSMFWAQVFATILAGTTQLSVQAWMFSNIQEICTPTQKDGFFCLGTQVFGTASIIWGVIGPKRQFSQGEIY